MKKAIKNSIINLGDSMTYLWLIAFLLLIIIEYITGTVAPIWFATSALISLIVSFFIKNYIIQLLIFLIFGILLTIILRPILNQYIKQTIKKIKRK